MRTKKQAQHPKTDRRPPTFGRFTSRGPKDRQEIAACLSCYRCSPFWTGSKLSESQMVDCWEAILSKGIGVIDIIENQSLHQYLKRPHKAEANPHFRQGFVYVLFVVYINFEFARRLFLRAEDNCDALIQFLEAYHKHMQEDSLSALVPKVGQEGEMNSSGLCLFSTGVFHTDISSHLSLRTVRYFSLREPFIRRVEASSRQFAHGRKHDLILTGSSGKFSKPQLNSMGYQFIRDYPGNAAKTNTQQRFLALAVRNKAVLDRFGPNEIKSTFNEIRSDTQTHLFIDNSISPSLNFSRLRQHLCHLLLVGYPKEIIPKFLYPTEWSKLEEDLIRWDQISRERRLTDAESAERANILESLKALGRNAKNVQRQISKEFANAGYVKDEPLLEGDIVKALMEIPEAAHEMRQFIFPVYPWPERLPYRA